MKLAGLVLMTIVVLFLLSFSAFAGEAPLVIATVYRNNAGPGWLLYPEISIDKDGNWRRSSQQDITKGQRFELYIERPTQKVGTAIVTDTSNLPARVKPDLKANGDFYWGFFSNGKGISLKGVGPSIKPKSVNDIGANKFLSSKKDKESLSRLVRADFSNIRRDFPMLASSSIVDVQTGDINGDNRMDYILILGEGHFGNEGSGPAAVIAYMDQGRRIQRLPISFWERTDDNWGWPSLLLVKDVNSDNAGEIFISNSDSDRTFPIVFSWFSDGLKKVYESKVELWNGF